MLSDYVRGAENTTDVLEDLNKKFENTVEAIRVSDSTLGFIKVFIVFCTQAFKLKYGEDCIQYFREKYSAEIGYPIYFDEDRVVEFRIWPLSFI